MTLKHKDNDIATYNYYLQDKKILKKFNSKRNQVYLIDNKGKKEVIKIFNQSESYYKEKNIYQILAKVNQSIVNSFFRIPDIITHNDQTEFIVFQYIYGNTVLDIFEECERQGDYKEAFIIFRRLIQSVDNFQNKLSDQAYVDEMYSKKLIELSYHGFSDEDRVLFYDINFKNFISHTNEIYVIDFENVKVGKRIDDFAKIIAYMLTYDPVASEFKMKMYRMLLEEIETMIGIDNKMIEQHVRAELKVIEERRGIQLTNYKF